jgi:hypothetical protein
MTDPDVGAKTFESVLGRKPTPLELAQLVQRRLEHLPEAVAESKGYRVLPGVSERLRQLSRGGHRLGIITGNGDGAAHIKLARGDLSRWFTLGAYASAGVDRAGIVRRAIQRSEAILGEDVPNREIHVIGDTPLPHPGRPRGRLHGDRGRDRPLRRGRAEEGRRRPRGPDARGGAADRVVTAWPRTAQELVAAQDELAPTAAVAAAGRIRHRGVRGRIPTRQDRCRRGGRPGLRGATRASGWPGGTLATDEGGFRLTAQGLQPTHLYPARAGRDRTPLPLETSRRGRVRRRRRALRLDQACRLRGGRGRDGCAHDPPVPSVAPTRGDIRVPWRGALRARSPAACQLQPLGPRVPPVQKAKTPGSTAGDQGLTPGPRQMRPRQAGRTLDA